MRVVLPKPTLEQEHRYREILLRNVESSWIEGVLEQSLHVAPFVELNKLSRADLDLAEWEQRLAEEGLLDKRI